MKVVWFGSLMVFSLSTLLSPQVFAQSGTSLLVWSAVSVASQEAMLQDSAFKTAVDQVAGLRLSLFDFKKKLDQMDSSTKELHAGEFDAEYKLIRAEMVKVIQDIDYSTAKITRTLRTLYTHKQNLQKTLDELQETRKHLEIWKKYLNQLLLLVYKVEREIYDEEGEQIDAVKLFIKSDAMPQLLAGDDTLKILLNQINTLMKEATMQEKQKSDTIDKFVKLRTQAQKSLDYYKAEIKKLEQKKAYLMSFMQLYNEKKLWAEAVSGVSSEEVNLHETINTMVADIVEKKYLTTNDLPEKIKQLADHADSSENETSPAAWPTYPISQILTIFKDPAFEKEYGFKNLSLKLAVEQGTPVYAMRDGIVYYTDTGSWNVNRMMILHTDGYISTYAYLSRIFVQQGDFVRRGQIIAQSGGEPGTEGAGFVSKGENLTFSLFKDGVAIDPLTVLDLSVVQDKDKVLPEEYRLKYFNDQYVRPIDITKVSLIKGDSVDERAQTFLNSYAVGTYRNVAFWDQVVAGTNIDRDMVICIGFAESTLGKFLATDNNIGNVGNNDRGDRIAYNNPFNGARLIPLTLNNQYLGNYHTIKQLSRYGNSDGKIYASSPINWQSNVQKCLSKIKGYYVPEDFPFRTWPNPNTQAGAAFLREAKEEKTMLMSGSVMKKIGGVEVSSL